MSSQFRSTRPEDAAAISRFMQFVFGMTPGHPGLEPRQMEWKYWRPHPDWEGSRGYVVERDGEIVAHGSVVPLTCLWGDRRLKMLDLIDWAGHPEHPGAGMALLKRASQLVDGVFIAGGTEQARKVFKGLGFREYPSAVKYAIPVHPFARLFEGREAAWKRTARLVRNATWRSKAGRLPAGWSARRAAPTDSPFPRPGAEAAVFERTRERVGYLLECPITAVEFYLVEKDRSVRGYFVLSLAVAQCRIAEAWVEPGASKDWSVLYALAIREAERHAQVRELVTVATGDAAARAGLSHAGFRVRGELPLCCQIRAGSYPASIRYQMVDNDNAWQHDGSSYFWS